MARTKTNTLITCNSTTIGAAINHRYLAELQQCCEVTGKSMSWALNRAVDAFLEVEAAVHMNDADPAHWSWQGRAPLRTPLKRIPGHEQPSPSTHGKEGNTATKKNARTSTRKTTRKAATTIANGPLSEEQTVNAKLDALLRMEKPAFAEFRKFAAEEAPSFAKRHGFKLEEEDFAGGLGIMLWLASVYEDAKRDQQPRVDAAIRYLDSSLSA